MEHSPRQLMGIWNNESRFWIETKRAADPSREVQKMNNQPASLNASSFLQLWEV
jgi:hypothetical protein